MKSFGAGLLIFILFITASYGEENPGLKNEMEKTSYALGMNIAKDMKRRNWDINPAALTKGFEDSYSGGNTLLSDDEMANLLMAFQQNMNQKAIQKQQEQGDINKKEGEAFLEANKTKKDIHVTDSGLQYKILKEGTGPTPKIDDSVTTHYRGTLINGTEFDSSYSRNEPATFPVNGVIPGWTEALQKMKTGSKWQLFVPSKLAYGERGAGQVIGPNAVLIFEVELLSVNPAKP